MNKIVYNENVNVYGFKFKNKKNYEYKILFNNN